jgi:hypothetical protein
MEFPRIVFKCPGDLPRQGGTFKVLQVADDVSHADAVADGWFSSLPEAIESHGNPKPVAVVAVAADVVVDQESRESLESRAKEIGIKFDGRTSDAKLSRLIAEASQGI